MAGVTSRDEVLAVLARWEAAHAELAALEVTALSPPDVLAIARRLETGHRAQPALQHRLIHQLISHTTPTELGAPSWPKVLAEALGISVSDAKRRITHAELLGPRTTLGGQPLAPLLAHTAAAQAAGRIGADHLATITGFFHDLPPHIDATTRAQAEADLARIATTLGPTQFRTAAHRLALLLNQDGELPDDAQRARRRYLSIDKQGVDGMSRLHGLLDPQARATLEAVLAKLGAPGMCNPDDDTPCIDGPPSDQGAHRDTRTPAQRHHDALTAMGRALLASGQLGQHNGLPATIIVTTTLKELQSGRGAAVTAGGTLLPMRDVISQAAHAHHYLVIFDDHTQLPLYCGRAKRFATPAQRIVLHARDRGCTKPGCTTPGYWCQVHHITGWAKHNGQTDITDLTLACGPDNRLIENSDWQTRTRPDGRTEWIPPPHLDTGQTRTNDYHHPQNYLTPEDDDT